MNPRRLESDTIVSRFATAAPGSAGESPGPAASADSESGVTVTLEGPQCAPAVAWPVVEPRLWHADGACELVAHVAVGLADRGRVRRSAALDMVVVDARANGS